MNGADTTSIHPVSWNASRADDPIEVFERGSLIERVPAHVLQRIERLEFHLVILCERGAGTHEVDFNEIPIAAGQLIHLEPGQVHRWRFNQEFEATLILFREAPVGVAPNWHLGSPAIDLSAKDRSAVAQALALLADERSTERSNTARRIALTALRDLLFVRLGLDRDQSTAPADLPVAYVAFRNDLETDLRVGTSMQERAARIGYSARTLSRAAIEVTGRTPKQLSDERIILEARRRLVQPSATVAQVATVLGFSEQTNFAKFFRRHAGVSPSEWIDTVRPD